MCTNDYSALIVCVSNCVILLYIDANIKRTLWFSADIFSPSINFITKIGQCDHLKIYMAYVNTF